MIFTFAFEMYIRNKRAMSLPTSHPPPVAHVSLTSRGALSWNQP